MNALFWKPRVMLGMHHSCGVPVTIILKRQAVTVRQYLRNEGATFWQMLVYPSGKPGELLEILEFHPSSDLWEVRERIAAMDRKSCGRWSREGESNRDGIFSREAYERQQREVDARSAASFEQWEAETWL